MNCEMDHEFTMHLFFTGQELSSVKASGFNAYTVSQFFANLDQIYKEHPILLEEPDRIWSGDETSLNLNLFSEKVIGEIGVLAEILVALNGKNVTMLGMFNAMGQCASPLYIFPGKKNIGVEKGY